MPRIAALVVSITALFALACQSAPATPSSQPIAGTVKALSAAPRTDGLAEATFAGGCFWCTEKDFEKVKGVKQVISGYSGGRVDNPTYRQVSAGSTGHTEVVRVVYDPKVIDYATLLTVFWHSIDPTVSNRQFCDAGTQYRSAIFAHTPAQKVAAEASLKAVAAELKVDVKTEINDLKGFWQAEDYHQDFYKKKPDHYSRYRQGCGRDARLKEIWGDKAGH
ncbi:MAG: peptide-methionine (S)-S-oxide reductase [Bradymonadia bacterium]|jgi:peptide-methionine (S)-S-oxide reductase